MESEQQVLRKSNAKVSAHVPERAWDSTVAMVIAQDKNVCQFATGVLFRVADDSFVVTAAHVIREATKRGKTLGISAATDAIVPVPGRWICSSEGQYGTKSDPFDVAVHRLSASAVDRIGDRTFLRLGDIEFDAQPATAVYTLFGFPKVWSTPSTSPSDTLRLTPFQYTTHRFERDTDVLVGYQERVHLLLKARLQHTTTEDGSHAQFRNTQGAEAHFPGMLGGISGCSVWRVGDLNVPIKKWSQQPARIVAVQTSVYRDKGAIKATRWMAVASLLHEAIPELRPAIELWGIR